MFSSNEHMRVKVNILVHYCTRTLNSNGARYSSPVWMTAHWKELCSIECTHYKWNTVPARARTTECTSSSIHRNQTETFCTAVYSTYEYSRCIHSLIICMKECLSSSKTPLRVQYTGTVRMMCECSVQRSDNWARLDSTHFMNNYNLMAWRRRLAVEVGVPTCVWCSFQMHLQIYSCSTRTERCGGVLACGSTSKHVRAISRCRELLLPTSDRPIANYWPSHIASHRTRSVPKWTRLIDRIAQSARTGLRLCFIRNGEGFGWHVLCIHITVLWTELYWSISAVQFRRDEHCSRADNEQVTGQ